MLKHAQPSPHDTSNKKPGLWRPGKAKRQQLEDDLAHVTQEMYRRNVELDQTNKMLALLESVDKLVLESETPLKPLSKDLAKKVVEEGEYPFVAIFSSPDHSPARLQMYGWHGSDLLGKVDANLLDNLSVPAHGRWLHNKELVQFVSLGNLVDATIAKFCDCSEENVADLRATLRIKTLYCIKLRVHQRLVGVMVIGTFDEFKKPDDFTYALLTRLGEATGIAIDHKMLLEENQRVLQQLEDSNSKLKVLDRAKDEFMSMASHQLRTPLTSVKGYLSMVLEGDAGPISEPQTKLLTEAFESSQRMVYLIGDFLNVSRLQTGKFVLENKPTDLSKVISQEVAQLQVTANRRNISVVYDEPTTFPTLTLDENKMRQVIMNFMDNAVYYSKPGSKVRVSLVATSSEVRFEVRDSGIGVPPSERHHLFTKFYRAENARKVRPDGTGIGLFMAKKVVVAHGGSIIFESEENVGSTFGFSLPLQPQLAATS